MVLNNMRSIFSPEKEAFLHQTSQKPFFWKYVQTVLATRVKNVGTPKIQAQVWKCIGQLLQALRDKPSELLAI